MVWSEQVGTSIVLPSDHVDGDGRNYIVIGEDVPVEIADAFTAALIFRYGGDDVGIGPYGFSYFALGITKIGALEVVIYRWILAVPSDPSSAQWFRKTVLSIASPVGVDKPPVLSLGDNSNYASFHEGGLDVTASGGIKYKSDGTYMYPVIRSLGGFNTAPPNIPIIMQHGTAVFTTNANGDATITFDSFPNKILNAFCTPGDTAGNLNSVVTWGYNVNSINVRCWGPTGVVAVGTVRVEYLVFGY